MQDKQEIQVPSLGGEDSLEEEMAIHSSILVWIISRTKEPGLYHWKKSISLFVRRCIHWWHWFCIYGRRKETLNRKRWNHNPLFLELLDFYTLSLFYDGCWRETAHGRHAYPLPAPHWPKIKWNKQTNKKPKNTQTKGHRTSSTKQRLLSVAVAKLRSDVMKLWDWGSKERVFLSLQVFPSCDSSLVSSELVFSQDAGCVFTHHAVWMGSPSGPAVALTPPLLITVALC